MKILICGLPGSGKTTLAKSLSKTLPSPLAIINADEVRTQYNDWDFSEDGRIRQAQRMRELADTFEYAGKTVIADFVCPTKKTREEFNADYIIWMNTIKEGRYEDTNAMFEELEDYDWMVEEFSNNHDNILEDIKMNTFNISYGYIQPIYSNRELHIRQSMSMSYIPILKPTKIDVGFSYLAFIRISAADHQEHLQMAKLSKTRPKSPEHIANGITKYRDTLIPKYVHEDLASGKCKKLILDYSLEGFYDVDWDYISTIFGVEKSKIVWLTGVYNPTHMNSQSDVTVLFNNLWEQFVYDNSMNPIYINEEESFSSGYQRQIQDINDLKIRPYHGLNYNRRPHLHRVYLLSKLKTQKLLDQTAFSWGGWGLDTQQEPQTDERIDHEYNMAVEGKFLRGEEDWKSIRDIIKMDKVEFPNGDLTSNKAHSINFDHIKDCYFQIISETMSLNDYHDPFLSEKSYKPFVSGMPFIMWGQMGTVSALKKQGYKTFNNWIIHDYDNMQSPADRFHALVQEIERLYAIPPEQWSIMLKEMLPDIEHNYQQIKSNCDNWGVNEEVTWKSANPRTLLSAL